MTVVKTSDGNLIALKTDDKPTAGIKPGTKLFEADTGKTFVLGLKALGSPWAEITDILTAAASMTIYGDIDYDLPSAEAVPKGMVFIDINGGNLILYMSDGAAWHELK